MEFKREQLEEVMNSNFFVHLAIIGEVFDDYVKECGGQDGELMNSYLDYLNDDSIPEDEKIEYPRFCFMALAKTLLTMQIDGKINLR